MDKAPLLLACGIGWYLISTSEGNEMMDRPGTNSGDLLTDHFRFGEIFDRSKFDGSEDLTRLTTNAIALAKELEKIRYHLGGPILITSGYRSPTYNKKVGGADHSQHLQAKAADFTCPGITPGEIYQVVSHLMQTGQIKSGGLHRYKNFVHYDIRGWPARW